MLSSTPVRILLLNLRKVEEFVDTDELASLLIELHADFLKSAAVAVARVKGKHVIIVCIILLYSCHPFQLWLRRIA